MSLTDLPDELIANMSSYLEYNDVCSMMQTSKKCYGAVKKYGKEKIKLDELWLTSVNGQVGVEAKIRDRKYSYKNLSNLNVEESEKVRIILSECASVAALWFEGLPFTKEKFRIVMNTKTKIKMIHCISDEMIVSLDEMFQLHEKFDFHFCHHRIDSAVWCDEVLTKLLPRSTVLRMERRPEQNTDTPMLITSQTLMALMSDKQILRDFSMRGVHNSLTLWEIAHEIRNLNKRDVTDMFFDFGILQPEQLPHLDRYFGPTGELNEICDLHIHANVYNFALFTVSSLDNTKFTVSFAIAYP